MIIQPVYTVYEGDECIYSGDNSAQATFDYARACLRSVRTEGVGKSVYLYGAEGRLLYKHQGQPENPPT